MTIHNKISTAYRKPTRLEELFIKEYLVKTRGLTGNILVHSIKDSEDSCVINIEINKWDCRGKEPVLYSVKLMRVVL